MVWKQILLKCAIVISLNYVLPLKKINFENKVFLGPGNPDKMLEMEYGDYGAIK